MTDYAVHSAQASIDQVTEAIFKLLYHHDGDIDLQDLRKEVDRPGRTGHTFDIAVGSLVEKGDITVLPNLDSFIVHRTAPLHWPCFR